MESSPSLIGVVVASWSRRRCSWSNKRSRRHFSNTVLNSKPKLLRVKEPQRTYLLEGPKSSLSLSLLRVFIIAAVVAAWTRGRRRCLNQGRRWCLKKFWGKWYGEVEMKKWMVASEKIRVCLKIFGGFVWKVLEGLWKFLEASTIV